MSPSKIRYAFPAAVIIGGVLCGLAATWCAAALGGCAPAGTAQQIVVPNPPAANCHLVRGILLRRCILEKPTDVERGLCIDDTRHRIDCTTEAGVAAAAALIDGGVR